MYLNRTHISPYYISSELPVGGLPIGHLRHCPLACLFICWYLHMHLHVHLWLTISLSVGPSVNLSVDARSRLTALTTTERCLDASSLFTQEFLVVSGFIASPFGKYHMLANMYYNMHRMVYAVAPWILSHPTLHSVNEVSDNKEMRFNIFDK